MPEFAIQKISVGDAAYPRAFKVLHDPPKTFYVRGNPALLCRVSVAVVGTRRASEHALAVAGDFSETFARAGLVVVSGLAFGVDASSHEGALAAGGLTVAVLGSGVDDASVYPRANFPLARRILETGGAVVSENPPGTKPRDWDFPKRNRLIAALGAATVVVEAPEKSGSIITAKYALELGRDVYAVPADALRESAYGSNRLIADGAIPLLNPGELIENLLGENLKIDAARIEPHNQNEALLLNALKNSSGHADELAELTGLPAASVLSGLTALELRGAVVALGAMRYGLRRP